MKILLFWILCLYGIHLQAFTVIDPSNLVQTTLTAVNAARNLSNQALQMERDIQYMKQQVESFSQLGYRDLYKLDQHLRTVDSFNRRVKTITYNYRQLDQHFKTLYSVKNANFSDKYKQWNDETENSIKLATLSQGQSLSDSNKKYRSISEIVEKERKSKGTLQALQALAEINAIQARQIEELKTIIALDSQTKMNHLMEQKGHEQAAQARAEHLMKDFDRHTPSKPMSHLPKLGETAY